MANQTTVGGEQRNRGAADVQSRATRLTRARMVRDLFDAHYERVYCFLRRSVSAERAEDLAQEVFFRLLKHRHLERITVSSSYLIKIAENLVKNGYRRDVRLREVTENLRSKMRERSRPEPKSGGELVIDSRKLEGALRKLTPNERSAITLIVCRGLSYQSASLALGVSITTINNWKHRGISKLKDIFNEKATDTPDRVIAHGGRCDVEQRVDAFSSGTAGSHAEQGTSSKAAQGDDSSPRRGDVRYGRTA